MPRRIKGGLTHFDRKGEAHMVDVGAKDETPRVAVASGRIRMQPATFRLLAAGRAKKGDVLGVARLAAIQAAKRTPELIPLCHPIAVHGVDMEVAVAAAADEVRIAATVRTADRTGVEMEALTAVAVAGLAVIDMVKAIDPHAALRDVQVEAKDGGRSGRWSR